MQGDLQVKKGDRVQYIGRREKYQNLLGTVGARDMAIQGAFFVKFDNGDGGLFSHASDFVAASAVDQLGDLAREP
jgi:hypothetical protein